MADPNHVIWHDEHVAFALPAKTANTAIKWALVPLMGLAMPANPMHVHTEKLSPFEHVSLGRVPATYDVIGLIRHPLRRFWSAWVYLKKPFKKPSPISLFLRDVEKKPRKKLDQHIRPQWDDLAIDGCVRPTRWLVVESLDRDWASLCRDRGWPARPLARANVCAQEFYPFDPGAIADVEPGVKAVFADDYRLYRQVSRGAA